jgi:multicomponent Na+:H+ antiporter subunit B
MSRMTRQVVFLVAAGGFAALMVLAFLGMPHFGGRVHPYRDLAVPAAIARHTPNVVSSVNFDQRGIDTLGEETILLGSVIGAAALLRPSKKDRQVRVVDGGRVLQATRFGGYVMVPVTLLLGADVVIHGHLTPGGGFQGGVVLATGLHLQYVCGDYRALQRLRPLEWCQIGETLGAAAFAGIGLAGLAASGAFLKNVVPLGMFEQLVSAGTVPLLNIAVGVEVACGVIVLLASYFRQALTES